jgi:putative membrane protein
MLKDFRDHAANERTFLAWIRTAIAVMALGFLLERFDLFLGVVGAVSPSSDALVPHAGRAVGLVLVAAGPAMIVLGALRFRGNRAAIEDAALRTQPFARTDVALAALIALLACALALYVSLAVL